jgi:4-hydroxy-tetrahydrodipicolinate synthase
MQQMRKLAMQRDAAGASAVDAPLTGLHSKLFLEGNPVPVKWAMHKLGLIGPGIRLPLVELSSEFRVPLLDAMRAAGLRV